MTAYERILVKEGDDGVTLFTLNRPERRNAICKKTALELQAAFEAFDRSETQRVAVLTGAGDDSFSGGADVTDLPELWRCVPTVGIRTNKPIIVAVGGWCVGGALVIAMTADMIVAADNAKFSYPEAKLGFTGGMIAGLAGRIPHHAAMEMILWGRPIDAARAHSIGFVNEIVPKGQQVEAALKIAAELATFAPLVLQTLKRFVNDHVVTKGPTELMNAFSRDMGIIRDSADTKEGMAAFREKRAAKYTGR